MLNYYKAIHRRDLTDLTLPHKKNSAFCNEALMGKLIQSLIFLDKTIGTVPEASF